MMGDGGRMETERARLKNMILSFRVAELQTLLQRVQKNKTGKKNILQERAIALLDTLNDSIVELIRQLHQQRFSTVKTCNIVNRTSEPYHNGNVQDNSANPDGISFNHYSGNHNVGLVNPFMVADSPKLQPVKEIQHGQYVCGNQNNMHLSQPVSYVSQKDYENVSSPRLIPSSFFDIITTIVNPKVYGKVNNHVPSQQVPSREKVECRFNFKLDNVNELSQTRRAYTGNEESYGDNPFLQMRVSKIDEPDDYLPVTLAIMINSQALPLPKLVPVPKSPGLMRRPCVPLDITTKVFLSPRKYNSIVITWDKEDQRNFPCLLGVSVHLVKKVTAEILVERLKTQPTFSEPASVLLILKKFNETADDDIAATTIRASVICPLGKMTIQKPCRAKGCAHVQCFDGEIFIKMNEKKPSWVCPICDRSISFLDIQVDELWIKILKKVPEDTHELEFLKDGSWSFVKNEPKRTFLLNEFMRDRNSPEVITIDSDSDVEECCSQQLQSKRQLQSKQQLLSKQQLQPSRHLQPSHQSQPIQQIQPSYQLQPSRHVQQNHQLQQNLQSSQNYQSYQLSQNYQSYQSSQTQQSSQNHQLQQNRQLSCIPFKPSEETDDVQCIFYVPNSLQAFNYGASTSGTRYVSQNFNHWSNLADDKSRYSDSPKNSDEQFLTSLSSDDDIADD